MYSFHLFAGKVVQEVPGCHRLSATSLDADASGNLLASGGADGLVKLWPIKQVRDRILCDNHFD